jgi:two-component system NtrC family response regulator
MFLGKSKELEKSLHIAKKAALSDASILLLGESGVGKELFAKYIHQNSKRAKMPFIAINMAAIPENLLESELFGYEKGAFTDATTSKKGFFELSDKGTIFLDELAEMPVSLQPKILRVLQEKELTRVGGSKTIKIDIRVISATNADIKTKIKDKSFREDLYYRLNTIPIQIPPLRERKDEIAQIANKTLINICHKYGFNDKIISDEAIDELLRYGWPGNIRELISVIERAAILSESDIITKDDLFLESRK